MLQLIEEIQCNDNIPKNYGIILDIMRHIRKMTTFDLENVIKQLKELKTYKLYLADAMLESMERGNLGKYVCLEDVLQIMQR